MMRGDGKISVEAEKSGPSKATLTIKDMRLRRRVNDIYGKHHAVATFARLKKIGFPEGSMRDLEKGYPVRFRMLPEGYLELMGRKR